MGTESYRSPDGFHRHRCGWCGFVWEHADACRGDGAAHYCPVCEQEERFRYTGDLPPGPAPVRTEGDRP